MSQRVIWTTGQRKWCSAWCRDFIASTGLPLLSSPITLSLPAAVTAYCGCIRAWPRKCRPLRSISEKGEGAVSSFSADKAGGRFRPAQHLQALVTEGAGRTERLLSGEVAVRNQKGREMFPAEVTGSIWVRGICSSGTQRKPGA